MYSIVLKPRNLDLEVTKIRFSHIRKIPGENSIIHQIDEERVCVKTKDPHLFVIDITKLIKPLDPRLVSFRLMAVSVNSGRAICTPYVMRT